MLSSVYLRNIDSDGLDFAFQALSTLEIRDYGTWPTFFKLKEMLDKSSLQRLVLHVKPKNVMQQILTGSIRDIQILLPELRISKSTHPNSSHPGFLPSSTCSPAQSSKTCS